MEEETKVDDLDTETQEIEETSDDTTEVEETTEDTEETVEDLKADRDKYKKIAEDRKIRAEKAEKKSKSTPKVKAEDGTLSNQDVIYLAKADIHEEDIEEVSKYASKNDLTVKEAHVYLKPILDVRKEERTTADATNVKGGARGGSKIDGDSLLQKAEESGEVPTTAAEMKKLAEARIARKKAK